MAGKITNSKGFTLIEIVVTLAIGAILMGAAMVAYKQISTVHVIQTDLDKMITFLQDKRLKAFTQKTPIIITVATNQLTNDLDADVVDMNNDFTGSAGTFTINSRGLFNVGGFIRLTTPITEYSCINIANSSVREGKWNVATSSCDAK